METGDGDAGAEEDAMPEAGNGGAERTRSGGGGFASREVALCIDCAPDCLVSIGGPAPLGGVGDRSPNSKVPHLGCRRPGSWGSRDTPRWLG